MDPDDELAEVLRLSERTALEEAAQRQAAEDAERTRRQEFEAQQARRQARLQDQEEEERQVLLAIAASLEETTIAPQPAPTTQGGAAPPAPATYGPPNGPLPDGPITEGPRVMEVVVEEGGNVRARVHLGSVDAAAFIISPNGTRLAIVEAQYGVRIVQPPGSGGGPEVDVRPAETGEDLEVQRVAVQVGAEALVHEAHTFLQDPSSVRGGRGVHHIFIDASNIMFGAQTLTNPQGGATRDASIRVNPMRLWQILECNRGEIRHRVVVGSSPNGEEDPQWAHWRGPNDEYTLRIERRARGQGEQGVDATVRDEMNTVAYSHFAEPHTIVLLTGDGNSSGVGPNGPTFPKTVETALRNGFNVEVWSWRASLSRVHKDMQAAYPGLLRLVYLDGFRHRITFHARTRPQHTQGGHRPSTASGGGGATHRPTTHAQSTPPRPRSSSVGSVSGPSAPAPVPPPVPPPVAVCPEEFECPLTLDLMEDPVTVTHSGITYERAAIMQVITSGNGLEPSTRAPLSADHLVPNRAIRALIERYRAAQATPQAQESEGRTEVGTRTITVQRTPVQPGRDSLYELHYHAFVVRDTQGRPWSWRDVSARYERGDGTVYTRVLRLPCDETGQPYRLGRYREERVRQRSHDVFVREPEPSEPTRDPQDPTAFVRNSFQYPFQARDRGQEGSARPRHGA